MITIPGRAGRNCEGMTRREWLRIGGLAGIGGLGVGVPDQLAARALGSQGDRGLSFGRAKSCIVLFMFGAPAHQDTWDMKPHAPLEVRSEFSPISTTVPGTQICEHMPRLAQLAHRYTLVRSVTHADNTHTVAMHYMLTGMRHKRPTTNPQNASDDFPCFGAVMNYDRRNSNADSGLPAAMTLNGPANQVSANDHIFPGFFAGFLGNRFTPMFVSQHANQPDFRPLPLLDNAQRLTQRKGLLDKLAGVTERLQRTTATASFSDYHQQAIRLLTSPKARRALDITLEEPRLRERYGDTPFGQGCLLSRRLVEAGVPLVTVNWERDDAYWDTHADNFSKHKNPLLPNLDRGFSALLEDLDDRNLLDETLVVCLSEFGRTPKINKSAGRDHWAGCNTVVLAGGGIVGGQVYGASDREAAWPTADPVRPEDLAATIYHLLGIDPHMVLRTAEGQPLHLSDGEPIWGLFG